MKNIKKSLAVFLGIVIIITAFPIGALAKSKAPSKPTSLSFTSSATTITLKWKKVSTAKGYTVYLYNSKTKKYSAQKTVTKNSYKSPKLSSGTTYTYAVKSYKLNKKKKVYSAYSSKLTATTLPETVKGIKAYGRNVSSVNVSWNKVNNAKGYLVKYSTDKNFKSGVKSVSVNTLNTVISSLQNKTYYFKVFAFKTLSNKKYYSSSSSIISSAGINSSTLSSINTSIQYQTIKGFGASGEKWGQIVGGWDNAERIIKYLYDKKEGIGLNIYRYNIGAGSKNDSAFSDDWSKTECFIQNVDFVNQKITYDFSRDEQAQNSLRIAKKLAGDGLNVSLFSNSPPVTLTKNSKAYCPYTDEDDIRVWKSNLEPDNYELFSQFECDVADYFVNQGYNICDISPVNEPQYAWAEEKDEEETYYVNREGAHYKPDELKNLYSSLLQKSQGKSYGVSMFESGQAEGLTEDGKNTVFTNYVNEICSLPYNRDNLKTISVHSYWSNAKTKKECRTYVDSIDPSITVSSTEYCQNYNDISSGIHEISKKLSGDELRGYTIEFGVQMARVINEDLTILNSVEWDWWTACSNKNLPEGLIYLNESDHNDIKLTKRLWCLGNYSRFIESGATRVEVKEKQTDLLSSAFLNLDGSLVIVYVNQTDNAKNVNIDAPDYTNYQVYETSKNKDLKYVAGGDFFASDAVSLPAQSVVSVILTK